MLIKLIINTLSHSQTEQHGLYNNKYLKECKYCFNDIHLLREY